VGWVWGAGPAAESMREGSRASATVGRVWGFFIRYVCPIVIFIVLLNIFGLV